MNVTICLEKYSDWLEAYSIFRFWEKIDEVTILYIENERNNKIAVETLFAEFKKNHNFKYKSFKNREDFFTGIAGNLCEQVAGDILAAPFIRYRKIWKIVPKARKKGIITVHLSESLPDSFGRLGYRLGYRLGFRLVNGLSLKGLLKQFISLPLMYVYAVTHKPDYCFYNMFPAVKNKFVKKTLRAYLPSVESKKDYVKGLTGEEKRPLLIGGFGYDVIMMSQYLGLSKYIATSKNKEIIIDGKTYPLDRYICAEEVMLSGCTDAIIGYNSTAICWAILMGSINIDCYESNELNNQYGFLFGKLSRKTLKKCGVDLKSECTQMIKK